MIAPVLGLGQNELTSQIKKLNGLIQELELETSKRNQNILEENFSLRLDSLKKIEFGYGNVPNAKKNYQI